MYIYNYYDYNMITMTDVKCFMHPYTCQNPSLLPCLQSNLRCRAAARCGRRGGHGAGCGRHLGSTRGTPPLSITNFNMNCLKLRPLGPLLHVATSENKTLRPP